MTAYTIAVLKDACRVMDTLLGKDDPLTLTSIAGETGLSKNKVFRILATLEECKLVRRTQQNGYSLHIRFLDFAAQLTRQLDVVVSSSLTLDWLAEQTGESVYLRVIDGTEAICVAVRESSHAIRLFAELGHRAPLYAGATPLVLLAYLPVPERKALLEQIELRPLADQTLTDLDALEEFLGQIRKDGYAVTHNDLTQGASGVAAPIRNFKGEVVAAVAIGGLTSRFTGSRLDDYISSVVTSAARISGALGYKQQH
jgi:DNA-binding IclR family transcriptional regulator